MGIASLLLIHTQFRNPFTQSVSSLTRHSYFSKQKRFFFKHKNSYPEPFLSAGIAKN